MNKNTSPDSVAQLCPKCGLCCNGVLFADVELRKGDDVQRLAELGLSLEKKGRQRARIDIAIASSYITSAQVHALRGDTELARHQTERVSALFDLDQARIVEARVRRVLALRTGE